MAVPCDTFSVSACGTFALPRLWLQADVCMAADMFSDGFNQAMAVHLICIFALTCH